MNDGQTMRNEPSHKAPADTALYSAVSSPNKAVPKRTSKKDSRDREPEEKEVVRMNPLRSPVPSFATDGSPRDASVAAQQPNRGAQQHTDSPRREATMRSATTLESHETIADHVHDEAAQSDVAGSETTPTTPAGVAHHAGGGGTGNGLTSNVICDFVQCREAIATHSVIRCLLLVPFCDPDGGAAGSTLGSEFNVEQELRQWSVWGASDDGALTVWSTSVPASSATTHD
jgi:hypothetical protein